jgi:hypothetical protein
MTWPGGMHDSELNCFTSLLLLLAVVAVVAAAVDVCCAFAQA